MEHIPQSVDRMRKLCNICVRLEFCEKADEAAAAHATQPVPSVCIDLLSEELTGAAQFTCR